MFWSVSRILTILLGLLIVMSSGLALAAPLVLTEKDSGKTINVKLGQRFTVNLILKDEAEMVAPEFDLWILSLLGQTMKSTSGKQGSSAQVSYNFQVRKVGQTYLVIPVKISKDNTGRNQDLLKVKIVAKP